MSIKSIAFIISASAALIAGAANAASTNLVTNGGFESTTGGLGQFDYTTHVNGWSSGPNGDGYNFVFGATGADSVGVNGQYGNLQLWGPGNGSNNGFTASPAGGNFVAADGAYNTKPIIQSINGLTAGQKYNVSFYWAGIQQSGYDGAQTEQWSVSLGNQTQSTSVYQNTSHGFSGWKKETFTFTANSANEVLSFLAVGTPTGVPPFSLLDGVELTAAVPEPETWAMLGMGLGLMGFVSRRRKAKAAAAQAV
jgi:hypothetical protein